MTEQELKQNGITAKTTPNHKTVLLTKHLISTAAANCYYSTTKTAPTTGLLAAQQQHNRRKTNRKNSTAPGSKKHSQQLRNRLGNHLQANCTTCQTPRLKPPTWHHTRHLPQASKGKEKPANTPTATPKQTDLKALPAQQYLQNEHSTRKHMPHLP